MISRGVSRMAYTYLRLDEVRNGYLRAIPVPRLRQRRTCCTPVHNMYSTTWIICIILILLLYARPRQTHLGGSRVAGKPEILPFFTYRFKWVRFVMHHRFGVLYRMNKEQFYSKPERAHKVYYRVLTYIMTNHYTIIVV